MDRIIGSWQYYRCLEDAMASKNRDNTNITISSAGAIKYPSQPAFLATYSATSVDQTGDGTIVTLIPNSELYDQTSSYDNATGIFTAPVSGKYLIHCNVQFGIALAVGHTSCVFKAIASNRTFTLWSLNPYAISLGLANIALGSSFYLDMDAGDTVYMTFVVSGGAKVIDIVGTLERTFIGGILKA